MSGGELKSGLACIQCWEFIELCDGTALKGEAVGCLEVPFTEG